MSGRPLGRLTASALSVWRTSDWGTTAGAALLMLGVALRLRAYVANRSLWLDESFLALNIVERSFAQLLQPLDHLQRAPIGFLLAERAAVTLFGPSEYALRLFPLLCGMGSIFLFWRFLRRTLSTLGAVMGLAIFSISDALIYYAAEAKPYSVDVAVALLLAWAFIRPEGETAGTGNGMGRVAILGAVAVWFSYPAICVLGGIAWHWLWKAFREGAWRDLVTRAAVAGAWVASFLIVYALSMREAAENALLRGVWRSAAAPLVPRSFADLGWYVDALAVLGSLPLGKAVSALAIFAAILGACAQRGVLRWFAGIVLLTWLASALERYPLAPRLWLFLTPFMITLVAAGIDDTWNRVRKPAPALTPVLIGLLLAYPTLSAARDAIRPRQVEEVRPLLDHARAWYRKGDVLYLYYWAEFPVRYYTARGRGFPGEVIVGVVGGTDTTNEYARDVERLRGRGRVWLMFSHVQSPNGMNEERLFLQNADRIGVQRAAYHRTGASLYLYDFSVDGMVRAAEGFAGRRYRTRRIEVTESGGRATA